MLRPFGKLLGMELTFLGPCQPSLGFVQVPFGVKAFSVTKVQYKYDDTLDAHMPVRCSRPFYSLKTLGYQVSKFHSFYPACLGVYMTNNWPTTVELTNSVNYTYSVRMNAHNVA